ncbi:MAG: hypothetical protein AB7S49_09375, partial [Arcobacter sp.]|uniref:hypothetical protein n=1 Tax=Arcobacter sp. TaxID=1872629 RepID=UPI003D04B383
DDIKDFEANPNLLEQIKYAVASACDYWANKSGGGKSSLNAHAADEGTRDEVVLKISAVVNGYHPVDIVKYYKLSKFVKNKYKKATDNLYIRTPNGYNERLENFHKLKQHMKL